MLLVLAIFYTVYISACSRLSPIIALGLSKDIQGHALPYTLYSYFGQNLLLFM